MVNIFFSATKDALYMCWYVRHFTPELAIIPRNLTISYATFLTVNSLFKLSLHSLVTAISHISALYYLSIRDKECVICRAT
jgi:hypothetical protein